MCRVNSTPNPSIHRSTLELAASVTHTTPGLVCEGEGRAREGRTPDSGGEFLFYSTGTSTCHAKGRRGLMSESEQSPQAGLSQAQRSWIDRDRS
jgi:hypothetical protein